MRLSISICQLLIQFLQIAQNFRLLSCQLIFQFLQTILGPGRFPGNAGNQGSDGKFQKSHQILNQTKRNINKLYLGKISRYKTVRIKFSVDSGFSSKPYDKKRKHRNAGNQQIAF